jgi:hypothetical protein
MKKRIFTMAATLTLLITACTKQQSEQLTENSRSRAAAAEPSTFISGWETVSNWSTQDSGRFKVWIANRNTPELTDDVMRTGAVLVYVRNYNDLNGNAVVTAARVPFALYPDHDIQRPAYHEQWYYTAAVSNIRFQYRTDKHQYVQGPVTGPGSSVQYRVFVIPANDLTRIGQTPAGLSALSYNQVVQLFGTTQ